MLPPPPGGIGGGVPPAFDMVTVEVLCIVCGVTINVAVGDVSGSDWCDSDSEMILLIVGDRPRS